MHELTICQNLIALLRQEQAARRFSRVSRVRLEIGQFSAVEPEALRYAFAVLCRGTFAEGATLDIDQPPGRATCLDCGADVARGSRLEDCPSCGSDRLRPTGGDQLRLVELEVS